MKATADITPTTGTDLDARLAAAIRTVIGEISRTDGKAAVLLASFSLPLAVLLAAVPGRSLPAYATVLIGIGTTGLVAAMLVVLFVVRPNLSGIRRGTFLYWARCTPQEAADDVGALGPDGQAEDLVRVSRIARRKFLGIRWAGDITAASLTALAIGLLTSM
ncbi:Pycsar system effector family protein [Streptomyces sp. NPDC000594]|uniref:Pycsar system effector family protein n=1 Tax=Streptomyces sp. NPDC000594 TaxID=3154261 RepID=UPI0033193465